jgi:predicted ribosomally synthesized peptide with SipW-like signal peptide
VSRRRAPRSLRRAARRRPPWWRSVTLRAILSLGLVLGFGLAGTFAYWTDQATVSGITFTAGVLDLEINDDSDDNVSYTSLNISNMVPGNSVAGTIKVENSGNVPFTYTATSSASNGDGKNLAGALQLKVTTGSVSGSSPSATCSGSTITGPVALSSGSLVGSARSLAASANENLCIQVSMPSDASSSLQGGTTNVTLTFTATQ